MRSFKWLSITGGGADKAYAPHQKTHPATGAAKDTMTVLQVLAIHPFKSFLRRLRRIITENKVDIIQGQFLPHSHYAAMAGFLTGRPAFVTIHSTRKKPSWEPE